MDKKGIFINLSNHPSSAWDEAQLEAARTYGEIVDMVFPPVPPEADHDEVNCLAEKYVGKIAKLAREAKVTVHVMGEMTFTYAVVSRLKAMGIACVASTTERIVVEADGKRTYTFRFSRFREY